MDLKVPDGRYTITFDVQEGRAVNIETAPETTEWLYRLVILLTIKLSGLIALFFDTSGNNIRNYSIVMPDGSSGDFENIAHRCMIELHGGSSSYRPCVYFLTSPNMPGYIKIGQTKHPFQRAVQLNGSIFHHIPCLTCDPEAHEIALHNFFSHIGRVREREWFQLTTKDIGFIQSLHRVRDIERAVEAFYPEQIQWRGDDWWKDKAKRTVRNYLKD